METENSSPEVKQDVLIPERETKDPIIPTA